MFWNHILEPAPFLVDSEALFFYWTKIIFGSCNTFFEIEQSYSKLFGPDQNILVLVQIYFGSIEPLKWRNISLRLIVCMYSTVNILEQ